MDDELLGCAVWFVVFSSVMLVIAGLIFLVVFVSLMSGG